MSTMTAGNLKAMETGAEASRRWTALGAAAAVLFVLLFWPIIQRTIFIAANGNTWLEAGKNLLTLKVAGDWSHALVIPFLSYYFYRQQKERVVALIEDADPPGWTLGAAIRVLMGMGALGGLALLYLGRVQGLGSSKFQMGLGVLGVCAALFVALPLWAAKMNRPGRLRVASLLRLAGLALLLGGIFNFAWWLGPGRNDMFQGYSMVLALFGLLLFVLGPAPMTYLWMPVFYLALAVKVAPRWWDGLAGQLKVLAAFLATHIINVLGMPMELEAQLSGARIDLFLGAKQLEPLEVDDACAGLRMLMAFIALGVAMAFLGRRLWWQRLIMVMMTVPIAVLVNVGRIVTLGFIKTFVNSEMAKGDFHLFIGMLMLIPAAGLFWLMGWVLDKMVVFEDEDETGGIGDGKQDQPGAATEMEETAAPASRRKMAIRGLSLGLAAAGFFGGVYLLSLAAIRPDLTPEKLKPFLVSREMTYVLLGLLALLLGGAGVGILSLVHKHVTARQAVRWFTMPVVVGMLLVAVVGLNGMISASKTVLFKKEVPLRKQLYALAQKAGNWRMEQEYPELPEEQVQVLGTKLYIRRLYVPTTSKQEGAAILHVAYYTGTPDTVPHVPERCFVAGGMREKQKSLMTFELGGPQFEQDGETGWKVKRVKEPYEVYGPDKTVPMTCFQFYNGQTGANSVSTVNYFFVANGRYYPSPDDVRMRGFDPRDKYSYYCKVEVLWPGVGDAEEAKAKTAAFLSDMLPEIMACLPDWGEVVAGKWPDEGK